MNNYVTSLIDIKKKLIKKNISSQAISRLKKNQSVKKKRERIRSFKAKKKSFQEFKNGAKVGRYYRRHR